MSYGLVAGNIKELEKLSAITYKLSTRTTYTRGKRDNDFLEEEPQTPSQCRVPARFDQNGIKVFHHLTPRLP